MSHFSVHLCGPECVWLVSLPVPGSPMFVTYDKCSRVRVTEWDGRRAVSGSRATRPALRSSVLRHRSRSHSVQSQPGPGQLALSRPKVTSSSDMVRAHYNPAQGQNIPGMRPLGSFKQSLHHRILDGLKYKA